MIVANADISTKGRTDTDHESNNEMNQAQRDHDPKSSSHDPSGQLLWLHVTCYERSCIVPLMGKSFLKLFGQIWRRRFGQAFPERKKHGPISRQETISHLNGPAHLSIMQRQASPAVAVNEAIQGWLESTNTERQKKRHDHERSSTSSSVRHPSQS